MRYETSALFNSTYIFLLRNDKPVRYKLPRIAQLEILIQNHLKILNEIS